MAKLCVCEVQTHRIQKIAGKTVAQCDGCGTIYPLPMREDRQPADNAEGINVPVYVGCFTMGMAFGWILSVVFGGVS